ncbi:hypothetical protein AB0M94_39015, partial [Streptomyces xanthochromogenes]|uniref:hypothetical protein n=1 Tax=Streptomyces xanthochromogenes TaxID=67384 RepID=UPI00342A4C4A
MSLRPFVVAVEPEHMTRLKAAVSAARSAELDWLKEARTAEGTMYLRGRALSEALARIRVERATLRAKGKLAGTRDLVLAREVRAELRSRAMLGPYEPVPEEDASAPGRRVGTGPHHYGRMFGEEPTTLTERMAVRLPADLGEQLVRSCYWVSAPAVEALLEWQQLWGDGPTVIMREAQRRGG